MRRAAITFALACPLVGGCAWHDHSKVSSTPCLHGLGSRLCMSPEEISDLKDGADVGVMTRISMHPGP